MVIEAPAVEGAIDTRQPLSALFRDLRTSALGLSGREAQQRLIVFGPNELPAASGRRWPSELGKQVTPPLALVLVVAAVLAWWTGTPALAAAIVAVIVLNAGFAFVQELQAERAVEALAAYLPARARVLRDHQKVEVEARTLVPGDILVIAEGDRVCADGRIIDGELDLDQQASTVAWLGIVACQIGTAFAARTERASLRAIGVFSNPALLVGIAVEIAFALALVYVPLLQPLFGTAALSAGQLVLVAPFPLIVWGADELRRLYQRRRRTTESNPSRGRVD